MLETLKHTKISSNNRYQTINNGNLNNLNNNNIAKSSNSTNNYKSNNIEHFNPPNLYQKKKICLFYKATLDPNKISKKILKRYTKKVCKSKSIMKNHCQKDTSDFSKSNDFIDNLRHNSNIFKKININNSNTKEYNEKNLETDINELTSDKTEDKVQVHIPNLNGFMKGKRNSKFFKNKFKNENIFNKETFCFLNKTTNIKNFINSKDLKNKEFSDEKDLTQRQKFLNLNNTNNLKVKNINLCNRISNKNISFKMDGTLNSYDEVVKRIDFRDNPNFERSNIATEKSEDTQLSKNYSFLKKLNFDQPFRFSENIDENKTIFNNINIKIPRPLNHSKLKFSKSNNKIKKYILNCGNNKNNGNKKILGRNYKIINSINFKNVKKIDIFNINNYDHTNLNTNSKKIDTSCNTNNTNNNYSNNINESSSDDATEKEFNDDCKDIPHLINNKNRYKTAKIKMSIIKKQNSSNKIFENKKTVNYSNDFKQAHSFSTVKKNIFSHKYNNFMSLNINVNNPINRINTSINFNQPKFHFSDFQNNLNYFIFDITNKKFKSLIENFLDLKSLINLSSINNNFFNKMRNVIYNKFYYKIFLPNNTNIFKNKFIKNIINSLLKYSSEKIRNLKKEKLTDVYKSYNYKSRYNECIINDLTRTFPEDENFNKNSLNYYKLYNILTTYSNFNKQIGYVQGLNFLSAIGLYLFDKEEEVFVFLDGLINRFELNSYIGIQNSNLISKISFFSEILNKYVPEVITFFNKNSLTHEFFSIGWNLTLFSNCMEKNCLIVVWCFMVIFGWKFFYCFAIELLKYYKDDIINTNTKMISDKMKNLVRDEIFVQKFGKIIGETFKLMKNKIVL